MNNNIFLKRFYETFNLFEEYFDRLNKNVNNEDVHQLRVCIKKMRIILKLLEKSSKTKFRKKWHLDNFRSLFKSTGKYRELQINIELAKAYKLTHPELLIILDHMGNEASKEVRKELLAFNMPHIRELNNEMEGVLKDVKDSKMLKTASKDVKKRIRKVEELILNYNDENDLHKIRRHLKSVNEITDVILETGNEEKFKIIGELINPIHKLIGLWHDESVFLNFLQEFWKDSKVLINQENQLQMNTLYHSSLEKRREIMFRIKEFITGNKL